MSNLGLKHQVLLWARGKSLYEVRNFLGRGGNLKFEEIHKERKKSVVDDNVDIFSKRRRSSVKIDTKLEDQKKTKSETDKIRKIRQMVDFDENSLSLSTHQKNMYGIVEEK